MLKCGRSSIRSDEAELLKIYPKEKIEAIKEACLNNKDQIIKCLEDSGLIKYDPVVGKAGYILEDGMFCIINRDLGLQKGTPHSSLDVWLVKHHLLPGTMISYKQSMNGSVAMYYLNAVRYNYKMLEHYIDIDPSITDEQLESVARLLDLFAINKTIVDVNYWDQTVKTYDFHDGSLIVDEVIREIKKMLGRR